MSESLFFIIYDLNKDKDYSKLYRKLKSLGAKRFLESAWYIKIDWTKKEIFDYFRQYIDADDGLVICEVDDWTSINTLSAIPSPW